MTTLTPATGSRPGGDHGRGRGPITAAHAGTLVTVFAIATALTVATTRIYLDLTGYPSIGGAVYHLAHALWGGLFLMIACVLLLALRGRWVDPTSAVVGGIGAGLFVDEVGKFITRSNDYFFPLAAPIVYLCIITLGYAAYAAGRRRRDTAQAHLQAGFDLARELIDGPATTALLTAIRRHAEAARTLATDPAEVELARALTDMARARAATADTAAPPWWIRVGLWARRLEARLLPAQRHRRLLRLVLTVLGWSSIVGGGFVLPIALYALQDPSQSVLTFERTNATAGRLSLVLYAVAAAVGIGVGVIHLLAARALGPKRLDVPLAWRRTVLASVLSMVVVNTASAYIDQFASLSSLAIAALVLAAMASFTTRSGHSLDGTA